MPIGEPTNIIRPAEVFPPATLPTVFADGIFNMAPGPEIVRFYLHRVVPNLQGDNTFMAQPFLQIVMPLSAFLQMQIFLETAIKDMIDKNTITQEQFNQIRSAFIRAQELPESVPPTNPPSL